ncbi:hypothetical protein ISN44_Un162g000010 [Arabidopsis suecica]|uniref:Uncharacterized protein n=1 Tax=Arabidopsis suecica TaxID=45249 RepID=A0A8T1XFC5_ARASU|nr:hypothetical protein ISN44_Un162g000010 [Arabidopsis suecica]
MDRRSVRIRTSGWPRKIVCAEPTFENHLTPQTFASPLVPDPKMDKKLYRGVGVGEVWADRGYLPTRFRTWVAIEGYYRGGMTDRLSDPVLGQKLLCGRGEWACHAWDDMDSSRPWGGGILGKRMAVGGGIFGMRPKYRDVPMGIDSTRLGWMVVLRWKAWIRLGCPELSKFTFCGCSWQPSFDGKWISAGSDTRLPVSCVSFALRLRYSQPRLDGPEYFGGVGERLMFLGQLNVRRMSGDRIASVCRLRARAPNYLPPILLSYFTGDVTLDDRIRGLCCVPN